MEEYHATRFTADETGNNDMQIFVKTVTGRIYTIDCRHCDFVKIIQIILEQKTTFAVDRQYLIYAGKQLVPFRRLSDYNIQKESTFMSVLRLNGKEKDMDDVKKAYHETPEWNETYLKLTNMGFAKDLAMNAAKLYPKSLDNAIAALIAESDKDKAPKIDAVNSTVLSDHNDDDDEKKHYVLSPSECIQKQFRIFLESMNMTRYLDAFKENECCDMDCIELFDGETLRDEIEIKSAIARKKFLKKCGEMKTEMDKFKTQYGISSVLYKRLAKYGLVTLDILSMEIQNEDDLRSKYDIHGQQDIAFLWRLIQKNTCNESNDNQSEPAAAAPEGNSTPYI